MVLSDSEACDHIINLLKLNKTLLYNLKSLYKPKNYEKLVKKTFKNKLIRKIHKFYKSEFYIAFKQFKKELIYLSKPNRIDIITDKLWNIKYLISEIIKYDYYFEAIVDFTLDMKEVDIIFIINSNNEMIYKTIYNEVKVYNLETNKYKLIYSGNISILTELFEDKIIIGLHDNTIRVWNHYSSKCELILEGHTKIITSIEYLLFENKLKIISQSYDGYLRIWDYDSGICDHILKSISLSEIKILPNNKIANISSHCIIIWDLKNIKNVKFIKSINSFIDYNNRIINFSNKNLSGWSIEPLELKFVLREHTEDITNMIELYDNRIITASNDKTLKIWNEKTFECINTLKGHKGNIICIALLYNELIISYANDKTLKIWDPDTGICLKTLAIKFPIENIIPLDNGRIITLSQDKKLIFWK